MKYIFFLVLITTLVACNNPNTATPPTIENTVIPTTPAPQVDAAPSSDDLINTVLGTHNGHGTLEYDNAESSKSKILNSVKIERRDDVTVIVSSPENLFPSYEIGEFRLEGHKIYGKSVQGYGFVLYDTKRKRIMALVKRFDRETADLRFAT